MKKIKHPFRLTIIFLFIICSLPLKSFANCENTKLDCLDKEVYKAIKKVLINKNSYSGPIKYKNSEYTLNSLKKFLKKRGLYDKYFFKTCEKNENNEEECYDETGTLDSRLVKELWGIDFDYASSDEEQRIKFLKQIGVVIQ